MWWCWHRAYFHPHSWSLPSGNLKPNQLHLLTMHCERVWLVAAAVLCSCASCAHYATQHCVAPCGLCCECTQVQAERAQLLASKMEALQAEAQAQAAAEADKSGHCELLLRLSCRTYRLVCVIKVGTGDQPHLSFPSLLLCL